MDKDLVETVARAIQHHHAKQVVGEIQKWETLPANERSAWRLIARQAYALIDGWERSKRQWQDTVSGHLAEGQVSHLKLAHDRETRKSK